MNKKHYKIAIDGHSSTGKSTLAKEVAKALNFLYIDTGAMYRAVTLFALKNNIISSEHFDKQKLINDLDKININFVYNPNKQLPEVFLNDKNVEKEIRGMEVSNFVSQIATIPEVREKLVDEQRKIAQNKSVVMDGRDIGSVVFPDADLKIFMTASPEIRAKRRFDELKSKDANVNFKAVLENVTKRDKIDSERKTSPLIKTDDAIEIDNSNLSKKQQFNLLMDYVNKKNIIAD